MNKKINFRIMPQGYGKTSKEVRDYITNLQQEIERQSKAQVILDDMLVNYKQENERLKERVAYLERSNNRREDTIIGLRFEVAEQEDYKSRCEKAIEYVKRHDQTYFYLGECELLNILQNGSEENVSDRD